MGSEYKDMSMEFKSGEDSSIGTSQLFGVVSPSKQIMINLFSEKNYTEWQNYTRMTIGEAKRHGY